MRATFKKIVRKVFDFDKSKKIYKNGADNNYAEYHEAVRLSSVTASMASDVMVQFILGKGFGEFDNFEFDDIKAIELAEDIAEDITNNRGTFILVKYDANYEPESFKVLPFESCRIGRKDSNNYAGKILYCSDWADKKNEAQIFDAFNPTPEIVKAQVEAAGGVEKYKGQIMFYSMDRKTIYPTHRLHSVAKDCENEDYVATYKNTIVHRGFFGKTMVITKPLIHDNLFNDRSPEGIERLRKAESEREAFKNTLEEFVGAENVGGVMHVELEYESDKIEEAILFKNIESNIDPDLFKIVEDSASVNILMAYKNLPIALVKSPETAMFGNSGEAIYQAQLMYQNNVSKERNIVETIVNDLWKIHRDYDNTYKKLIPLIDEKVSDNSGMQEV